MKTTIKEVLRRTYALLDENEALLDERVEYGDPATALRPLLLDLLPDAARVVICSLPLHRFEECRHLNNAIHFGERIGASDSEVDMPVNFLPKLRRTGEDRAEFTLPSDFLRLVNVKMSDWHRGVSTPMASGGDEHNIRMRWPYRRQAPAIAIARHGDRQVMQLFGTATGSYVAELDWIARPEINELYIDMPAGILPDVCAKLAEMAEGVITS